MLTQENYTKENIERLYSISGNDPSLLEKTIYAFGLLEAIAKVGMPFIFKGAVVSASSLRAESIVRNTLGFQMELDESEVISTMKN